MKERSWIERRVDRVSKREGWVRRSSSLGFSRTFGLMGTLCPLYILNIWWVNMVVILLHAWLSIFLITFGAPLILLIVHIMVDGTLEILTSGTDSDISES